MVIQTKAQTIEEEKETKAGRQMDRAHRGQAGRAIKMPGAN
jgi:hypothetical protein